MGLSLDQFRVVIPSFRRAEVLRDKTLRELQRLEVDPGLVSVFVADERDLEAYSSALEPGSYGELVLGVPGLVQQRNFITQRYPAGQRLLCCDDDVDGLVVALDRKRMVPLPGPLAPFVDEAFATAAAAGCRLWGVYPVPNPYFMRQQVTFDLRLVVGPFYGVVNDPALLLSAGLSDKEDHQRTLDYYLADGGVMRYSGVAVRTRFYDLPGGLQSADAPGGARSAERVAGTAAELVRRYPGLVHARPGLSGRGYVELDLKDRRGR